MESIYYVMTYLCHRTCEHCYEDRFHPYHGPERGAVVKQSQSNFARIIENLPPRMTYLDRADGLLEKTGRIILAGGEILLVDVRESVLYPAIKQLRAKYRDNGGVRIIVQTTGDLVTPKILSELLERQVDCVTVSGIDAFHEGLESEGAREALVAKLTGMFEEHGMSPATGRCGEPQAGPQYAFFGATPESWIGKIWPRGRAHANELSTATLSDNFCNAWSGGLGFLEHRHSGSEVSIDPEGNVYPCCMKTQLGVGNLLERNLEAVLDGLRGNSVYQAISSGRPELMGAGHGWSAEKFIEKSKTILASGREYQNLCVGCDAFHNEVLRNAQGLVTLQPSGTSPAAGR